jgi:hypothetical protein
VPGRFGLSDLVPDRPYWVYSTATSQLTRQVNPANFEPPLAATAIKSTDAMPVFAHPYGIENQHAIPRRIKRGDSRLWSI